MLCIIAGSRSVMESDVLFAIDHCPWKESISSVVSGTAAGSDRYGERWAKREGLEVIKFPAEWDKYGMSSGPRRNKEMAQNADALVAIWDGASRGTMSMIQYAKKMGLKVMIYFYNEKRFEYFERSTQQLALT
jgi:hypothetical protein